MRERMYLVSESRLKELIEAELRLEALESGGVDNWEWYGEAGHDYIQDYCSCNKQDIVNFLRSMNNHIGISDEEVYEEERDDIGFSILTNIELLTYEEYR